MSPTSVVGHRMKVQHFVVSSIVCSSTANKSSPTAVSSPTPLPVRLWHSPTNNTIIDEYERETFRTIQWCCQADKTAILQSQAKALKGVNQEQLALYYGIGRYISQNSREGFWGKDAISTISRQLSIEMPGLRDFLLVTFVIWGFFTRNGSVSTLIWQIHLQKKKMVLVWHLYCWKIFLL